jgi:hypothetical protein
MKELPGVNREERCGFGSKPEDSWSSKKFIMPGCCMSPLFICIIINVTDPASTPSKLYEDRYTEYWGPMLVRMLRVIDFCAGWTSDIVEYLYRKGNGDVDKSHPVPGDVLAVYFAYGLVYLGSPQGWYAATLLRVIAFLGTLVQHYKWATSHGRANRFLRPISGFTQIVRLSRISQ